jgi:hypothetical protein
MAQRKKKSLPVTTITTYTLQGNMLGDRVLSESEYHNIAFEVPLSEDEFEGEGLPPKILKEGEHPFFDFTFEVRIAHDTEGKLELVFAKKGTKRHTIKVFEGLTERQACIAKGNFERKIRQIIKNACISFAWACYDRQSDSLEKRKETYKGIMEHTSNTYKEALIWERYKTLEEPEENGVKIVKSVPSVVGNKSQTKEEILRERREFLEEIFFAFKELSKKKIKKPKQKDLIRYVLRGYKDKQKKISEMLKKHQLNFNHLWTYSLAYPEFEVFLSVIPTTNKITRN